MAGLWNLHHCPHVSRPPGLAAQPRPSAPVESHWSKIEVASLTRRPGLGGSTGTDFGELVPDRDRIYGDLNFLGTRIDIGDE